MTGLRAGHDRDPVRGRGEPLACRRVGGDRLAQGRQPEVRPVVGEPVVERLLRRRPDVGRGVEVGLADLEVDHAPARRLERPGPRRGLERRLRADPGHPIREPHGPMLAHAHRCARTGPARSLGTIPRCPASTRSTPPTRWSRTWPSSRPPPRAARRAGRAARRVSRPRGRGPRRGDRRAARGRRRGRRSGAAPPPAADARDRGPDAGRRRLAGRPGHRAPRHRDRAWSTSRRSSRAARSGCAGAAARPRSASGTTWTRGSPAAGRCRPSPTRPPAPDGLASPRPPRHRPPIEDTKTPPGARRRRFAWFGQAVTGS